jgi:hypothetical protein
MALSSSVGRHSTSRPSGTARRQSWATSAPCTSKDIDYLGHRQAAEKLATAIGGSLRIPDLDNTTPQLAIVVAKIDKREIEIDFLTHVLGVKSPGLENAAVEISCACARPQARARQRCR